MLRGVWRWFTQTRVSWVPMPRCPICHREVVNYRGARVRGDGRWSGRLPTEREVLIDHCPVHGRRHEKRRNKGRRTR
jgi:hypothetical protein